jgi:tetratricopeptide (TPR) repeat protein
LPSIRPKCNTIDAAEDGMTFIKDKYLGKSSELNTINAKLDLVESLIPRIDGKSSPLVEQIFLHMDEIFKEVQLLRKSNVEMAKIDSQINYISNRIYASAKILLKSFGGKKALEEVRQKRQIPEDRWWWYLDHYLINKRKKNLQKVGIVSLLGVVVIAIMVFLYNQFLAPPPEVLARIEYEEKIDEFIAEADYASAMREIDPALALTPDYYPLWIKKGVLAYVLGDEQTEIQSYEKAKQLSSNPEFFYYERANIFMQFGLHDEVLAEADYLLEINPDSAEAFLFQGLVLETRGQLDEALDVFEKAATLAEEQNKTQLAATIRVRMGMMMQTGAIPTPDQ